jgi:phenylalanyl-tRNA synthetase beta chain
MLEVGQPLHAFDMDRLDGPGIVVRDARDGEHLTTLDDVERTFTDEDLLICDTSEPVAIAGVMGGQSSEVSTATTNVLLESAAFTRGRVLLTARRLDLHSEASHRFERGTDPEGLERGAARGAQLIAAWTGASVLDGVTAAGTVPERRWVSVRPSRAATLLGYPVSADDALRVFETLSMRAREGDDAIAVEVPGYRRDIDHEVDLIEEIVRIQGYDRVGARLPRANHSGGVPAPYAAARLAKGALVRAGLREIRPAPFASQDDLDLFGDTDAISVANPLRADEGFLRTRLTPGLLHAVATNQAAGARQVALFEVGTTFRLGDPFTEHRKAGFVLAGPADEGWATDGRTFDVLDAKGVLEGLLHDLGVRNWELGGVPSGPFHPGRSASVIAGGNEVGVLGEIAPSAAAALDLEGRVSVAVVGLGSIAAATPTPFAFEDVPRFPAARRDLAFVVPRDVAARDLARTIEEAGAPLLDRSVLFDVFEGPPVPDGSKSLAYAIELRASDRTLTDDDVEPVVAAIADAVGSRHGGRLRTS